MSWFKKYLRRGAILAFVPLLACSNIFENMSNKESDEALYEDALKLTDASDFTGALAKYDAMSAGYQARTDVLEDWAGALAGACGFDFINYLNQLGSSSLGSTTLFKYLMNAWTGKTVVPTYCTQAEAKIKAIWAVDTPTQSQKLFIVALSLAKMGVYLRYKADNDGTGNLGDNSVDGTYDSCSADDDANTATDPAHLLTDDQIKEVVTGLSLFLLNVTDFAASLGGIGSSTAAINAACGALTPNPCATTDAASVTASMVNSMRDILKTAALGVEACVNPTVAACCLPNPN